MKQALIIIGAGNVGGYLAFNISDFPKYHILGFLDDNPSLHGKDLFGYQVLGNVEHIFSMNLENMAVAVCIHHPVIKKTIVDKLQHLALDFPNFISPHAWISKGVSWGKGNIIYPGVSINYESIIGDFVIMNMNCALGHHARVGNFCSLAPQVSFGGKTILGSCVDMGISSATLQGRTIGEFSIIGGQSMIIQDVPPRSKVVGVPGKVIGNGFIL